MKPCHPKGSMGFPWLIVYAKKLASSGPSKNRTETTRRGVNAPEDQQLEPDDDGLENDFSSSRNFIVRFHVNLSGCTPLIPFANETRKISAFLLSTEAGPQSDCEFWRQVHQRTAAASLNPTPKPRLCFPRFKLRPTKAPSVVSQFCGVGQNTGSNPLVVFRWQVNGASHLVFLEKIKTYWFYKVHQKNHERICM